MKILTPLQKIFLEEFFASYFGQKFFLSGGTALAIYYLQHRKSEDLDLFTLDQKISFSAVNAEINKIAYRLNFIIEHQVSSPTFLRFVFKFRNEFLKVDLVKDTPLHFGKIRKIRGFFVDSLENIAVGKLLALFGRADAKDFIDLYFLLKEKRVDFNHLFRIAKKKDLGLSEFYLAEMVSRIKETKHFPATIKPFEKKEMVGFFLNLGQELYQKIKPKE